jgi:hypothetical protein
MRARITAGVSPATRIVLWQTYRMPLRICFLAAEYSPFAKTGGLGDVAAALTRHLARRGHDLRVFVPLHGQMELQGVDRHPVDFLQGLTVRVGAHEFRYDVQTARVPDSTLWVYLVGCGARPSAHLFRRTRRARALPGPHTSRVRVLPAHGLRPADHAFERLAHGVCTAAAAHRVRLGHGNLRRDEGILPSTSAIGRLLGRPGGDLRRGSASDAHLADLAAGRVNPMRHAVIYGRSPRSA